MNATLNFLRDFFPTSCHGRIVLVGGSVRDFLLHAECRDIDLAAALTDKELLSLGFHLVASKSATTIYFKHLPPLGKIEITRLAAMDHLADDLGRRDFTINAMAMTLTGTLLDPMGGKDDIGSKLLEACTDRSFTSDPLRLFRAFRFEADEWRMTARTRALIRQQDWSAPLQSLPVERFSREMLKALASSQPERFFELMRDFTIGKEFVPELFLMSDIPAGPLRHHPEGDLLSHTLQVLQRVARRSTDPVARFCAFFHDIGKLSTDPALYPGHHGHEDAGFSTAVAFCNRLRLPASYRTALSWISRLHGKANKWHELRDSTKVIMARQAIAAHISSILPLISTADKPDHHELAGWDTATRVAGMTTRELGIAQEQLERMTPGNRPAYVLQKRVERLRNALTTPLPP